MCQLQIQPHLFNPLDSHQVDIEAGQTLGQILSDLTPEYQAGLTQPLIARVNGQQLDPSKWETRIIGAEDVVVISPRPFGLDPFTIALAVISIGTAAYSYIQMRKMKGLQKDYRDLPEQSPTYDTNAQGNSARLGQPVPIGYGNHITWPDFAAQPYRRYENGKQYLYCLFAIGQGKYQLSNKKIGNTAFDRFEGIEEQLCLPGDRVDLFAPDVLTSGEVSNLDLHASNDPEYTDWSGPYTVCPVGVECKRIELDFILSGLYEQNDQGDLIDATAAAEAEYRTIDDAGEAVGGWLRLLAKTFTDKTVDVLRFTVGQDVALGRYEVQVRRSDPTDVDNTRLRDDLVWGGLKAVVESDAIYDHTVWAVKALVTGQLSGQSERKFNCMAQRLVDVWDGSQWISDQPSRNVAWAFCDMVKGKYAGEYSDEYLDLPVIKTLADTWEIREDYFDYRFDTLGTLDSALQLICRAGRAVKVEYDGVYSIVRDQPKVVPDYQFGMTEIINGSLKVQYITQDQWADDSVEVSYIDNATGQPHTINCALPGKTSLRPRKLKLEGVTSRQHAYREGMFEAARAEYRNRIVTYKTELAGGLADFGSCVAISHVMSDWGISGEVQKAEIVGGNTILTLSEQVVFAAGEQHVIQLADIRNQPQGPFVVTAGANPHEVVISTADNAIIYTGFKRKRTGFQFGIAEQQNMRFIMRSIAPEGGLQFTSSGEYDDPIVHSFDELINDGTLPLPEPPSVFSKDLEQVQGLRIAFTGSYSAPVINITWSPVENAERYVLQVSRNAGVLWSNLVSTSDLWYKADFDKAVNRMRIAAMSDLVGPWIEKEVSLSVGDHDRLRPNSPTGLALLEPFVGLSCKIKWDEQLDANRWRISVCNSDGLAKRTIGVTNPEYSYTAEDAKADGLGRHLLFKIWAENNVGDHSYDYAELTADNPQIGALTNITGSEFIDTAQISASTPNAEDFEGYLVWLSPTPNFAIGDNLLVSEGSRGPVVSFPIAQEKVYAKIAGYDAWDREELTVSSEITFTRPLIDNSRLAQALRDKIDLADGNATAITEIVDELGSQILLKAASRDGDGTYRMAGVAIGTGAISRVLFYADKFGFMHPDAGEELILAMENGKTVITNAAIGQLAVKDANIESLNANKIDATELSAITANLGAITAGSMSATDGVSYWDLDTGFARFNNVTINGHIEAATGNFVKTLNVAGNAITHVLAGETTSYYELHAGGPEAYIVLSGSYVAGEVPQATNILVSTQTGNLGDSTNLRCTVKRNNVTIGVLSVSHPGGFTQSNIFMFRDPNPPAGNAVYAITLGNDYGSGGPLYTQKVSTQIQATLR